MHHRLSQQKCFFADCGVALLGLARDLRQKRPARLAKNGPNRPKWPKMAKMAENGQKWPKTGKTPKKGGSVTTVKLEVKFNSGPGYPF